jgi:hydroxymethylpyrimidine pyrophosphatase-like HAD family hydrolase
MAVIGVDLDNTLVLVDKALEGAKEAINILREAKHKIVIHSCNNKSWIEKVLNNNDIRYDYIWDQVGKPLCDLYVDDKGYHFPKNGNWNEQLPLILERLSGLDNRKWKAEKEEKFSSISRFACGLQLDDENE